MLKFVPVERPGGERERMRQALLSARRSVQEALGPDAKVGPIEIGGFEVVVPGGEEDPEETIRKAIAEGAMNESSVPGLLLQPSGAIVPDEPPADV